MAEVIVDNTSRDFDYFGGAIFDSAQALLLTLWIGITPGEAQGQYRMLKIEPRSDGRQETFPLYYFFNSDYGPSIMESLYGFLK